MHTVHLLIAALFIVLSVVILEGASRSATTPKIDYDYYEEEDELKAEAQSTTEVVDEEPRFTYGEDDAFGPYKWRNKLIVIDELLKSPVSIESLPRALHLNEDDNQILKSFTVSPKIKKLYENNFCQFNWRSPVNILTHKVRTKEIVKAASSNKIIEQTLIEETAGIPETLIIKISIPNMQHIAWTFGHPLRYHGIEIRSYVFGALQLMDNFDPLPMSNSFTTYDFHFLSLFYCDLEKASPHRTMHQIDGKRFPLELEFVFLRKMTDEERSSLTSNSGPEISQLEQMSTLYDGDNVAVIVSVIGELGPEDNKYFQPVVDAAKRFHGLDFDNDDIDYSAPTLIKPPWSPTWLLPDSSDYYYYDEGSFPVPPCWSVARYYLMRERIKISQLQLDTLAHIRTEREKKTRKLLPCTHSISLVNNHTLVSSETPVSLNLIDYEMGGEDDGKPRSKAEVRKLAERKKKTEILRKRLAGNVMSRGDYSLEGNEGDRASVLTNMRLLQFIVTQIFRVACVQMLHII